MKLSIILGSVILLATALTPISAHADDQNLQCRRMANGCDLRGSNGRLSISGFDINVNMPKSSDRGNRNRNKETASNTPQNEADNDTGGNDNSSDVDNDNSVNDSTDTADIDNNNDNNNDTTVDADNGTGNDTDPVADNNLNGPGHNNNDFANEGYNPYGGLYGPGT